MLLPFLITIIGIPWLLHRMLQREAERRQQAELEQAIAERNAERQRQLEDRQRAAEQRQLEKERTARLKAIEQQRKAEQKQAEQQRKAQYTSVMAQQNIDSLQVQRDNTMELYDSIAKLMAGNISEKQRISYTRQLMALDDKIYRIDNKIAQLMYQANMA